MRARSLPLSPLRWLQPLVARRLIAVRRPPVTLPHGDTSPNTVLARMSALLLVFAVACKPGSDATAEGLLLGLLLNVAGRLRLVRASSLVNARRVLRCGGDLATGDVLRRVVEREVSGVSVARGALGKLLLPVSCLWHARRYLLHRRLLVLWRRLLLSGGLVVHYKRFVVSRTNQWSAQPLTYQTAPARDGQRNCRQRSASGSTWTREVSTASQC